MRPYTLVTNNSSCLDRFRDHMNVVYDSTWTCLEVLRQARSMVEQGLVLITHPMAGSLKPNQTPYRSVVLANRTPGDKDPMEDLLLLERGIDRCETCLRDRPLPQYSQQVCKDFRTLDLSFIEAAMSRSGTDLWYRC